MYFVHKQHYVVSALQLDKMVCALLQYVREILSQLPYAHSLAVSDVVSFIHYLTSSVLGL